jgi:hypothetical protein
MAVNIDPAEVERWVAETTAAQGLPVVIADPKTIAEVVALLREGREPVRDAKAG